MGTRNGRRIAIASVAGVGALVCLGREHIRFTLAFETTLSEVVAAV